MISCWNCKASHEPVQGINEPRNYLRCACGVLVTIDETWAHLKGRKV